MGIGLGIILLVLGLILTMGAVNLPDSVDDVLAADTLGWILIIAGVLAIVLALVMNQQRARTTHVEERREV
jgi:fumarate reductase subunit D